MKKNTSHPTPMKKSKARFVAALCAVFALLPALVLGVFAYPAEDIVPSQTSYDVGSYDTSYGYKWLETVPLDSLSADDPYTWTFVNMTPVFNSAQSWSYACAQLTIENEHGVFGHYSIGFCLVDGVYNVRIGWDYTIDGVRYEEFPVYTPYEGATDYLIGIRLVALNGGAVAVEMQYLGMHDGQAWQVEYVNVLLPSEVTRVAFELKTEWAELYTEAIQPTEKTEHMPTNLYWLGNVGTEKYNAGYNAGFDAGFNGSTYDAGYTDGHEAGVDEGYANGYEKAIDEGDMASSFIWDVLSMPFVIVSSILNFEILGVNIWTLASGLLTVVLLFWILKKLGVL